MNDNTSLVFAASTPKDRVLESVRLFLISNGYVITESDLKRPWGGYFYVDEKDKQRFAKQFFPDKDLTEMLSSNLKFTPKILIIQPGEILSWQYHDRRGEIWNLVAGKAGYKSSPTDEEPSETTALVRNETVTIPQGTRHRLVGSTETEAEWGIVAEIWSHTNPADPSNEADNYRLKDKYSRT